MKVLLCIVLASALLLLLRSNTAMAGQKSDKPSPQEVLRLLDEGNARFAANTPLHPHPNVRQTRLEQAASEDQSGHAIATVLGCSDSRVPVELLFDQGVMDIFVVRVAGNVVNTDEAGSIEYGLNYVHTPVLVVLGHTQCGAVTAVTRAVQGETRSWERNIPPLVAPIKPAVERVLEKNPDLGGQALVETAIEENVWLGIERLFMISPATRELVASGETLVVGAVYDVGSGRVRWLPQERVTQILRDVEQNPERERQPLAE